MDRDKLRAKIDEYLATLSDTGREDWYLTERDLHEIGLENFLDWFAKEYLKLKAEFEPTPN